MSVQKKLQWTARVLKRRWSWNWFKYNSEDIRQLPLVFEPVLHKGKKAPSDRCHGTVANNEMMMGKFWKIAEQMLLRCGTN